MQPLPSLGVRRVRRIGQQARILALSTRDIKNRVVGVFAIIKSHERWRNLFLEIERKELDFFKSETGCLNKSIEIIRFYMLTKILEILGKLFLHDLAPESRLIE